MLFNCSFRVMTVRYYLRWPAIRECIVHFGCAPIGGHLFCDGDVVQWTECKSQRMGDFVSKIPPNLPGDCTARSKSFSIGCPVRLNSETWSLEIKLYLSTYCDPFSSPQTYFRGTYRMVTTTARFCGAPLNHPTPQ